MITEPLPRSSPTAQNLDAAGILGFLESIEAAPDIELHSLMILRHGQVVTEGWWQPYSPDELHLLYSLSKSFTATALGFAVDEGLVTLEDLLISHFEEFASDITHPWSRAITLRDLVSMSTGHYEDVLDRAVLADRAEPVRGLLLTPPDEAPGSVFAYNNAATYAVGAVVQRRSGQSLADYLRPRLFDPLGIGPVFWDNLDGRDLGFTGLHLRTEDIARFGQLYLQDGVWGGRQLLPAGWAELARQLHTPNPNEPNPDWQLGYGFQFWMSRHGYRGDGAYGQFCLILPEQDAVVVTTAATENMQGVLDAVWSQLIPAFDRVGSAADDAALVERLSVAALDQPSESTLADASQWFVVQDVIEQPSGGWSIAAVDHDRPLTIAVGAGAWQRTTIDLGNDRTLQVDAQGHWVDQTTFAAELIFSQTPHRLSVTFQSARGGSSASWRTVPLLSPSVLSLAIAP